MITWEDPIINHDSGSEIQYSQFGQEIDQYALDIWQNNKQKTGILTISRQRRGIWDVLYTSEMLPLVALQQLRQRIYDDLPSFLMEQTL